MNWIFPPKRRAFPPRARFACAAVTACACVASTQYAAGAFPADYVQAIDWSRYNGTFGVQPSDTFGQSLIGVMQNESRYELNYIPTQYNVLTNAPNYAGVPYYWAFTNHTSGSTTDIRPLGAFANGMATLLATKTYSPSLAGGITEAQALNETELAIRGVAFAHIANTTDSRHFGGGGTQPVGASNQSAYWAATTAEAAWMLWDKLSPETHSAVAKMVEYEANSFQNFTVPYWKTGNTTNYPGDTKAEENAWDGQFMALAPTMMPGHPNAAAWQAKASEFQVSVLSRQTDNTGGVTSNTMVDGKAVKDWLHGYNTFNDGVLINHSIIHPDYMATTEYQLSISTVNESLARRYIPQSTVFNSKNAYKALTEVSFTPGIDTTYGTGKNILSPGGTIFKRNADGSYNSTVYYPQGNDWNLYVVTDSYLNSDLTAEWQGFDQGKSFDSMGWAQARVNEMIGLQNRPGQNGKIYTPADWGGDDHGADEDFFHSNAVAWLQWWLMQNNQMSPIADHWGALPAGISGDYNGDGTVDAADYVVWRNNPSAYGVGMDGYNRWRQAFNGAPSTGAGAASVVPEPASIALVAWAMALFVRRQRTLARTPLNL